MVLYVSRKRPTRPVGNDVMRIDDDDEEIAPKRQRVESTANVIVIPETPTIVHIQDTPPLPIPLTETEFHSEPTPPSTTSSLSLSESSSSHATHVTPDAAHVTPDAPLVIPPQYIPLVDPVAMVYRPEWEHIQSRHLENLKNMIQRQNDVFKPGYEQRIKQFMSDPNRAELYRRFLDKTFLAIGDLMESWLGEKFDLSMLSLASNIYYRFVDRLMEHDTERAMSMHHTNLVVAAILIASKIVQVVNHIRVGHLIQYMSRVRTDGRWGSKSNAELEREVQVAENLIMNMLDWKVDNPKVIEFIYAYANILHESRSSPERWAKIHYNCLIGTMKAAKSPLLVPYLPSDVALVILAVTLTQTALPDEGGVMYWFLQFKQRIEWMERQQSHHQHTIEDAAERTRHMLHMKVLNEQYSQRDPGKYQALLAVEEARMRHHQHQQQHRPIEIDLEKLTEIYGHFVNLNFK